MELTDQWVVGFVDGDGCFKIIETKQGKRYCFVVSQDKRSKDVLYGLKKKFGCGFVNKAGQNMFEYRVADKAHLISIILPFFLKNTLRTSKINDFKILYEALYNMEYGEPKSGANNTGDLQCTFLHCQRQSTAKGNKSPLNEVGLHSLCCFANTCSPVHPLYVKGVKVKGVSEANLLALPLAPSHLFTFGVCVHCTTPTIISRDWLIGFIDAEANFYVSMVKNYPRPQFSIGLHQRDAQVLEQIKSFIGCGVTYIKRPSKSNAYSTYQISSLSCFLQIIKICTTNTNRCLLKTTKRISFLKFRKIVSIIQQQKHTTSEGIDMINKIRNGGSIR